jgi:hypothetical protein
LPSAARVEGEEGKGTRTDLAVVLVFLLGVRHGGRFGACAASRAIRSEAPLGSDCEWIDAVCSFLLAEGNVESQTVVPCCSKTRR